MEQKYSIIVNSGSSANLVAFSTLTSEKLGDKRLKIGKLPFGYDHKYVYSHIGYNLKVTDMQAAVGVAQLKKIDCIVEARKNNFKKLWKGLEKFQDYLILPVATENSDSSCFGFPITVKENDKFTKNEIVEYIENAKILTIICRKYDKTTSFLKYRM